MPFLQNHPNVLPAIIGGGALVGGLIAGRGPNIMKDQLNAGRAAQTRSTAGLNDAYSYYRGVVNGGPQLQAAVAPAANAVDQTYDAALKSGINSQYGRGGSLDKTIRTIQSGRAFSLADLYGNAQREGATGLAKLSGSDASRAAGLLGDANTTNQANQKNNAAAFGNLGSILMRLFGGNANHPTVKNGQPKGQPMDERIPGVDINGLNGSGQPSWGIPAGV